VRRSNAFGLILATALALLLALMPVSSLAVTQSDLDAARRRAEEAAAAAEGQADELAREIDALDARIVAVQVEVESLREQIAEVTARRDRLEIDIVVLENSIAVKEREIEEKQAELDERNRVLSERAATSYKQGDLFFLELIFNSKSISDLLALTSFVQLVMEQDERIVEELDTAKTALEEAQAQLARDLETLESKRAEILAEQKRLESLKTAEQARLDDLSAARSTKGELLAETQANAERLRQLADEEEAESRRIEAELRAGISQGSGRYDGVMAWPLPASGRITSPFGWRTHPIFGNKRFHAGIDVGRPESGASISGAQLVAAGDGEVVRAEYRGGYGNTVMIDHGDGVVSLYAHMSGFAVGAGEWVRKGETVGYVGSTGYSSGPHLHFEIRVNGTPVDPMGYLD
jgi:murein DD-endopeptidase MepM/ murein hydrolase activator NlpD